MSDDSMTAIMMGGNTCPVRWSGEIQRYPALPETGETSHDFLLPIYSS